MTEDYSEKKIFIKSNYNYFDSNITTLLFGKRTCNPFISIIIPTYNRDETLVKAVESALYQETDVRYEVIVIDNNDNPSDTKTLECLKESINNDNFCYYKNTVNLGMTGNWNLAIQIANGEYIVILHDDDKLHSNYISTMATIIQKRPNIGLISCLHREISDEDLRGEELILCNDVHEKKWFSDVNIKSSYINHEIHICGLLFNKEKAISIGGFDDYWYPCADYVFEIKLLAQYGGVLCKMVLADYRILNNESFKPEVAGRFPIVIYIAQGEINRLQKVLPSAISEQYRIVYLMEYENNLLDRWCKNTVQKEKLLCEFNGWRELYCIKNQKIWSRLSYKIIKKAAKLYSYLFMRNEIYA